MDEFGFMGTLRIAPDHRTIDGESHMADSEGYWDYRSVPPAWRRKDTGQFSEPPATELPTSTQIVHIQQEPHMSFNPDDANAVSRFFQGIADKVVLASTLAKELEELRAEFAQLRKDVEAYRENNARLDEEVSSLRKDRAALQDENAGLRSELDTEKQAHAVTADRHAAVQRDSDYWHNAHMQTATDLDAVKIERDTAQIRIMELEDALKRAESERDTQRELARSYGERLTRIKDAMERTMVPSIAA